MTENYKLRGLPRLWVIIVIIVHCMFFLLEAILWMQPIVYNLLISQLNNPVDLGNIEQALVLKNLFVNQGFYNLFLVFTGLGGFYLLRLKRFESGYMLLLVLCFSGTGAGIVLLFSTKAFVLAVLQGGSSALGFAGILPYYKKLVTNKVTW